MILHLFRNAFLGTIAVALWLLPSTVVAQEYFTISSFDTSIDVGKNAELTITETIRADFGSNERHGIFRTIPTDYTTNSGVQRSIRITNIAVENDPFTVNTSFGTTTIKIGDPDVLVTGLKEYTIHYRVQNALNEFPDHIELYWNATGTEWQTPIDQATTSVTIAGKPSDAQTLRTAYQGAVSSTELAPATFDHGTLRFLSSRQLLPGEGLTIVAGWPKGFVTMPSGLTKTLWLLQDNWPLGLPIVTLAVLIWIVRKFGRDPAGRGTIVPEFAPPKGVTLLESAVLKDERFQDRDLTAQIIQWAVAGNLRIHEPKKGQFELEKLKALTSGTPAEQALFAAFFDAKEKVSLTEVKHKQALVTAKAALGTEVLASLVKHKYFTANPQTVRIAYFVAGFLLIPLSVAGGAIFGFPLAIGGIISGVLIMIFAPFMPKRTEAGVQKKEEILGFELYLKTAERYRLKFAEQEKLFERFLPYAIAFGVAGLWAKAFKDIATAAPSWYSGYYGSHWSTTHFTSGLNSGLSNSLSAICTASSGGSWFSGVGFFGVFGGGVGGSW